MPYHDADQAVGIDMRQRNTVPKHMNLTVEAAQLVSRCDVHVCRDVRVEGQVLPFNFEELFDALAIGAAFVRFVLNPLIKAVLKLCRIGNASVVYAEVLQGIFLDITAEPLHSAFGLRTIGAARLRLYSKRLTKPKEVGMERGSGRSVVLDDKRFIVVTEDLLRQTVTHQTSGNTQQPRGLRHVVANENEALSGPTVNGFEKVDLFSNRLTVKPEGCLNEVDLKLLTGKATELLIP